MPGWFSPWELLLLILLVLVIFGPKRLPEMGKSLGKGMREFKDSITGKDDDPVKQASELPAAEPKETVPVSSEREHDA